MIYCYIDKTGFLKIKPDKLIKPDTLIKQVSPHHLPYMADPKLIPLKS